MKIINIEAQQLRSMKKQEGLVIQGCGGDLKEWAEGINEMLAKSGMFFPFEGLQLDAGKLAMWRLQTHREFGGTWLSDYVPNRLGGFAAEQKKQECELIGHNGNIFNLMGIASKTLKENDMADEAKEMCRRITSSGSYDEALCIISEYVEITSADEYEEETEEMGMEMI